MEALKLIDFFLPFFLLLLWYLFGMYSDTANNHGRLIAFTLPLAPLVFIVMYALFGISRIMVYPFFMISGKKEKYNDFICLVKNPWLWGFKGFHEEVDEDLHEEVNKDQGKVK
ncbi:MAG: hypothetical protein GY931_14260 [Maribacter sp.]|nr:hypothetical protein [Maribacter sp.]